MTLGTPTQSTWFSSRAGHTRFSNHAGLPLDWAAINLDTHTHVVVGHWVKSHVTSHDRTAKNVHDWGEVVAVAGKHLQRGAIGQGIRLVYTYDTSISHVWTGRAQAQARVPFSCDCACPQFTRGLCLRFCLCSWLRRTCKPAYTVKGRKFELQKRACYWGWPLTSIGLVSGQLGSQCGNASNIAARIP